MFDQQCLRDYGSRPTRSQQSGQSRQKMHEERQKVTYGPRSYRYRLGSQVYEMRAICRDNRNSPGTGLTAFAALCLLFPLLVMACPRMFHAERMDWLCGSKRIAVLYARGIIPPGTCGARDTPRPSRPPGRTPRYLATRARCARRVRFGAHPATSPHNSHDFYVLRRLRLPSNRAPGAISKVS